MGNVFWKSSVCITALLLVGFGAEAVSRYHHHKHPLANAAYGYAEPAALVQDPNQQVHVYYDHQTNMTVNAWHDGCDAVRCFIVTQTPDDVRHSAGPQANLATHWRPSGDDLFIHHPLVSSIQPQAHKRVVKRVTTTEYIVR